jgi:hypothetical protein
MLPLVEDEAEDGKDGQSERSRQGHYKRDRPEAARHGSEARSVHASQGPLVHEVRSPRQRDGDQRENERQRYRGKCLAEPDLAHQPRRGGRADEDAQREQSRDEGPGSLRVPHLYCLTYGRPTAAGGIERPMTPTSAMSVRT